MTIADQYTMTVTMARHFRGRLNVMRKENTASF